MGHLLTSEDLRADPDKVTAVTEMQKTKDKQGTQQYYLSKFCPNLSDVIKPLRDCVNKEEEWGVAQTEAFEKSKVLIANTPVLRYYDPELPVVLQVDASQYGLGAVLLQEGKLITWASCTLNKAEQNYAQIEKECLEICFGLDRFDQCLYGKPDILVHSDHKPLETIFKKSLLNSPKWLQKMRMRLQRYTFKVAYKPGKSLVLADTLSRAQLAGQVGRSNNFEVFAMDLSLVDCSNPNISSETLSRFQQETRNDEVLRELSVVVLKGWPDTREQVAVCLWSFWNMHETFTLYNGVVYKDSKAIIPGKLQKELLVRIQKSHQGAESCVRKAKGVLFWIVWLLKFEMCA